ncbi:MAG: hypothetical protein LBK41_06440 [Clostridiales bacterium]|jgi:hypothetical protein|nr:hypothetical protein [Clostridiales bacterium]
MRLLSIIAAAVSALFISCAAPAVPSEPPGVTIAPVIITDKTGEPPESASFRRAVAPDMPEFEFVTTRTNGADESPNEYAVSISGDGFAQTIDVVSERDRIDGIARLDDVNKDGFGDLVIKTNWDQHGIADQSFYFWDTARGRFVYAFGFTADSFEMFPELGLVYRGEGHRVTGYDYLYRWDGSELTVLRSSERSADTYPASAYNVEFNGTLSGVITDHGEGGETAAEYIRVSRIEWDAAFWSGYEVN